VSPQEPHPIDLERLAGLVLDASNRLRVWYGKTSGERVYAGRDAAEALDQAMHLIRRAREQLAAEIRVDNLQRAAQVDRLLAERFPPGAVTEVLPAMRERPHGFAISGRSGPPPPADGWNPSRDGS
jgi:hypothetical protein